MNVTYSPQMEKELLDTVRAGLAAQQAAVLLGIDLAGVISTPANGQPKSTVKPSANGTAKAGPSAVKQVGSIGDNQAVTQCIRTWAKDNKIESAPGVAFTSDRGRIPTVVMAKWLVWSQDNPNDANLLLAQAGAATRIPGGEATEPTTESAPEVPAATAASKPPIVPVPGTEVPPGEPITPAGSTKSPFEAPAAPKAPAKSSTTRTGSTRRPAPTGSPTAAVRRGRKPVSV
jgi:hypothetical protein